MGVSIEKNPKESPDRLISRFNKKVQASRILLEVKNGRYYVKPKTKRLQRKSAIMREAYRTKRNKEQYY